MRPRTKFRAGGDRSGVVSWSCGGAFEALEARVLLTGFTWSAEEVYFAELINRARMDPIAEAARLNIDPTSGLSLAETGRIRLLSRLR